MKKFEIEEIVFKDIKLIKPKVFEDERGFFLEVFNTEEFKKLGIDELFVQDNHSKSKRGVLRGLHFQTKHSQGKLVRVIKGAIYDVVVDIRKNSSTYGEWYGVELDSKDRKMLYIPKGFAHGFLTLEDETEIEYKCTDIYVPQYDSGIMYNDSDLNIDWKLKEYGIEELTLSEKDKKHQSFREYTESYQGDYVLLTGANGQLGQ
ncbi:dTDP-4-dehydrorhamnose 3,5-epimerase, partial [uncultured Fusobacterium sp.]|uniref:dTDP-4-dehydrorhamnose 3,5-epimerase n=1 Tax=uncultured Fusobacterium sp. TaxID=159267 RepID=UPI0025F9D059